MYKKVYGIKCYCK